MPPMTQPFRLGLTSDFLKSDRTLALGDIGLDVLSAEPRIRLEFLPDYGPDLPASVAQEFDGLIVLAPRVNAAALPEHCRLAIVARFGVGYDNIDVPACTRRFSWAHPVAMAAMPNQGRCARRYSRGEQPHAALKASLKRLRLWNPAGSATARTASSVVTS
jgi:hypothetical protein